MSHLPDELADAACRLATCGGFGGRELYSDHDEAIFDATCPLVFNAIPDLGAARPDFLDRAIIVEFLDMKPEEAPGRGAGLGRIRGGTTAKYRLSKPCCSSIDSIQSAGTKYNWRTVWIQGITASITDHEEEPRGRGRANRNVRNVEVLTRGIETRRAARRSG